MLHPTPHTLRPTAGSSHSSRPYFLSDVGLDIVSADTAVFQAKLNGPAGAPGWARAWLANEIDGTLAETASPRLAVGEWATLTVKLRDKRDPEYGWMRLESAPLVTEHVVGIKLPSPGVI